MPVPNYATCHVDVWETGGIAPIVLTSYLDGGKWPGWAKEPVSTLQDRQLCYVS